MIRLPDRLFTVLARVYRAQDRIRRREARERLDAEDRAFRVQCAINRLKHEAGECGGAEAGCRYVPCVPRVGGR